jgi:hypothetical protein
VPVVYLPTDGGAEDVMVRLGQRFGFDREKLESGDGATRKSFAKRIEAAGLPLDLDDELTIEAGAALLDEMCRARRTPRGVLFVDSIQTAMSTRHDDKTRDPRARVVALRRQGRLLDNLKAAAVASALMPNLRSALNDLASNFAASVLDAIRGANLHDLVDAQESRGGRRRRVPVRVEALNGYIKLKGQKTGDINGSVTPALGSRRLARRSPAEIARTLDAIVILLRKNKEGLRAVGAQGLPPMT